MSGADRPRPSLNQLAWPAVACAVMIAVALWALNRSSDDRTEVAETTGATTGTTGSPDTSAAESGATLGANPEIVVVAEYPHDDNYTQGLEFITDGPDAGLLLESGGQWGESNLRVWDPTTGEIVRSHQVDDNLFAEGTTVVGDQAWQLTWQAGTAFRYDLDSLEPVDEVSYNGEGWGLCLLGPDLVMSNGSSQLTFRDPNTFAERSTVEVTRNGQPVDDLNELECVTSETDLVWANVYQSTEVVGIDPGSGDVIHTIDASALVPDGFAGDNDLVLNGIAYNSDTGRYWLTGKRWPVLYEVELR